MTSNIEVLTIGHSTQSYEMFLERLRAAKVTAIADVRSMPYSRHFPHFSQDSLKNELKMDNISYVFLGDMLGGRPKDHNLYSNGVADYEKVAKTDLFTKGISRVLIGAKKYRIALMCSEHNPLDCHRCLLVGRALAEKNYKVSHILGSGNIISHSDIENELLQITGKSNDDLFEDIKDRLNKAYRERAMKVAYVEQNNNIE